MAHAMEHRFDIVTFDCYGTLIDWESGISAAFAQAGVSDDRETVLRHYSSTERLVEAEEFRIYRDVMTVSAQRVAAALGTQTNGTFLPESLPSWKPFPDTNAALERLRAAGYRLGILSNVDDDLIAETRKHFTVDFDLVITAQQVRSYKPGHAHFLTARERIGGRRWLHAAQSNFHDVVPANALGIPSAWVNRRAQSALLGGTPTFEVADLAGLADALT